MKIVTLGIKNPIEYILEDFPTKLTVVFDHDPYRGRNYRIQDSKGNQLRTIGSGVSKPIVDYISRESAQKLVDKLNRRIIKMSK